eukprot:gene6899-1233_t
MARPRCVDAQDSTASLAMESLDDNDGPIRPRPRASKNKATRIRITPSPDRDRTTVRTQTPTRTDPDPEPQLQAARLAPTVPGSPPRQRQLGDCGFNVRQAAPQQSPRRGQATEARLREVEAVNAKLRVDMAALQDDYAKLRVWVQELVKHVPNIPLDALPLLAPAPSNGQAAPSPLLAAPAARPAAPADSPMPGPDLNPPQPALHSPSSVATVASSCIPVPTTSTAATSAAPCPVQATVSSSSSSSNNGMTNNSDSSLISTSSSTGTANTAAATSNGDGATSGSKHGSYWPSCNSGPFHGNKAKCEKCPQEKPKTGWLSNPPAQACPATERTLAMCLDDAPALGLEADNPGPAKKAPPYKTGDAPQANPPPAKRSRKDPTPMPPPATASSGSIQGVAASLPSSSGTPQSGLGSGTGPPAGLSLKPNPPKQGQTHNLSRPVAHTAAKPADKQSRRNPKEINLTSTQGSEAQESSQLTSTPPTPSVIGSPCDSYPEEPSVTYTQATQSTLDYAHSQAQPSQAQHLPIVRACSAELKHKDDVKIWLVLFAHPRGPDTDPEPPRWISSKDMDPHQELAWKKYIADNTKNHKPEELLDTPMDWRYYPDGWDPKAWADPCLAEGNMTFLLGNIGLTPAHLKSPVEKLNGEPTGTDGPKGNLRSLELCAGAGGLHMGGKTGKEYCAQVESQESQESQESIHGPKVSIETVCAIEVEAGPAETYKRNFHYEYGKKILNMGISQGLATVRRFKHLCDLPVDREHALGKKFKVRKISIRTRTERMTRLYPDGQFHPPNPKHATSDARQDLDPVTKKQLKGEDPLPWIQIHCITTVGGDLEVLDDGVLPDELVASYVQSKLFKYGRSDLRILPQHFEVLTGGTPCQDFSGGNRGKRPPKEHCLQSPSNLLTMRYLQYVLLVRPYYMLLEQVPDFLIVYKMPDVFQTILGKAGYHVDVLTVDVDQFGCTQTRTRVLTCAHRRDLALTGPGHSASPKLPSPMHFMVPTNQSLKHMKKEDHESLVAQFHPKRRQERSNPAPFVDSLADPASHSAHSWESNANSVMVCANCGAGSKRNHTADHEVLEMHPVACPVSSVRNNHDFLTKYKHAGCELEVSIPPEVRPTLLHDVVSGLPLSDASMWKKKEPAPEQSTLQSQPLDQSQGGHVRIDGGEDDDLDTSLSQPVPGLQYLAVDSPNELDMYLRNGCQELTGNTFVAQGLMMARQQLVDRQPNAYWNPFTAPLALAVLKKIEQPTGGSKPLLTPRFLADPDKKESKNILRRADPCGQTSTILKDASEGGLLHPYTNRPFTERELARVHGFYDDFTFWGRHVRSQNANAVSPQLTQAFSRAILLRHLFVFNQSGTVHYGPKLTSFSQFVWQENQRLRKDGPAHDLPLPNFSDGLFCKFPYASPSVVDVQSSRDLRKLYLENSSKPLSDDEFLNCCKKLCDVDVPTHDICAMLICKGCDDTGHPKPECKCKYLVRHVGWLVEAERSQNYWIYPYDEFNGLDVSDHRVWFEKELSTACVLFKLIADEGERRFDEGSDCKMLPNGHFNFCLSGSQTQTQIEFGNQDWILVQKGHLKEPLLLPT